MCTAFVGITLIGITSLPATLASTPPAPAALDDGQIATIVATANSGEIAQAEEAMTRSTRS